jgi:uncharacterized membrane protein YdbT with pleckstrin-like domain
MFMNLPKTGVLLFQIVDIKNQAIRSHLAPLLRLKLSYEFLAYSIYASALVLVMMLSFYWLKVKTTTITLTNKFMGIAYGIVSREEDNIDLIDIRDQSIHQSLIQRIIGASSVQIVSNDKNNPNLFLLLTKFDAHQVFDFLQIHSTRSIVDYRMSQDLRGSSDKIGAPYVDDKPEDSDSSDPESK